MNSEVVAGMKIASVLGFVLFLLVVYPLASIWALNTLFPVLSIPYNFETWFAIILLGIFIAKSSGKK